MHKHQHHNQKQTRKEAKTMICHSEEYFCEWWPTEVATLNSKNV